MQIFTAFKTTNRFETYVDVFYAYFTTENSPILKTLRRFENLGFVTMSARENIRLIARASSMRRCILLSIRKNEGHTGY